MNTLRRRIIGGKKGLLPSGYTQLEYIESTGTQYIDTGIKPTNKKNIEIDVNVTQPGTQRILGTYFTDSNTYAILQQVNGNLLSFQIGDATQRVISTVVGYNTGFHNIRVINKEFFLDNISYGTSTGRITTSDHNAYIFSYNQTSTSPSSMQIKMCKIWDNDVLVRNFIPAKRNSDNVLGMYDTVTGTLFTNAGTGTFIAGPEV